MASQHLPRKLAAVLYADVADYSRLTGEDEEGTHRRLSEYLDLLAGLIGAYQGRVVHYAGDAVLADFDTASDALICAAVIQRDLAARNADLREERRVQFRIGVNLGEIIVDRDDLYGSGVNVAARLESLAEPGGICISESVRSAVGKALPLDYEFLGEQEVKNIAEPVRAWRAAPRVGATLPAPSEAAKPARRRTKRAAWTAASVITAIAVVAALAWWRPWSPAGMPAAVEGAALPVPDKPSIAVLPFDNLGREGEQAYFADGITEDIITDLSKVEDLFVISRNSTFTYKGKAVKPQQVARDLGVRYVLEGSVRRAGDKLRINAQLIDAASGGHVWADRYDGTTGDVFAFQDKVNRKILLALVGHLSDGGLLEAGAPTDSAAAYDAFLKGWNLYQRQTPEHFASALKWLERALELDPDYPRAHAALAALYWETHQRYWYPALRVGENTPKRRAGEHLARAMESPTPLALSVSADMALAERRYDSAVGTAERAVSLAPNNAAAAATLAEVLTYAGRPREALPLLERANRLDPHNQAYEHFVRGLARFALGEYAAAASSLERALELNPAFLRPAAPLAAAYGLLERSAEAGDALDLYYSDKETWVARAGPALADTVVLHFPYRDDGVTERLREGLVLAGVSSSGQGAE